MLPQTFFDRLIKSEGLRFGEARQERRTGARVPHRRAAIAMGIAGTCVAQLHKTTVRDISRHGIGILLDRKQVLSKDWILCLGAQLATTETSSIIRCRTFRAMQAGSTSMVIGAGFVELLAPGQTIKPGLPTTAYAWLPLGPDAVDPIFEQQQREAA